MIAQAALAVICLTSPALAQSASGAWEVACKPIATEARLGCVASTAVLAPKTGALILRLELIPAATLGNDNAVLRLHLPHGIALNASIGIRIDAGELYKIPLMSSNADGLLAIQSIGADVVAALKAGSAMSVTVVNTKGDTLTNSVSLVGLTLVLDSVARLTEGPQSAD